MSLLAWMGRTSCPICTDIISGRLLRCAWPGTAPCHATPRHVRCHSILLIASRWHQHRLWTRGLGALGRAGNCKADPGCHGSKRCSQLLLPITITWHEQRQRKQACLWLKALWCCQFQSCRHWCITFEIMLHRNNICSHGQTAVLCGHAVWNLRGASETQGCLI